MVRAVFVDIRDMPVKLYPYQFLVAATFTKTEDGKEFPLELHVQLTEQEARHVCAKRTNEPQMLAVVRDIVVVEVNKYLAAEKIPQKIIDQINGKTPTSDPPKEE